MVARSDVRRPDYDVLVIGAGSAGLTASQLAASLGKKVLLVERDRSGGECLYTGCIPSKTLLAVARRVWTARQATAFGLQVGGTLDWAAVRAELKRAIQELEPPDSSASLQRAGVHYRRAEAKLTGPHTVVLTQDNRTSVLTARAVVLATGSHTQLPDLPGLSGVEYLTHETLYDLSEQPRHLLIVGGGPIGSETAQAFARLGSRVTLLQQEESLLPRDEPEAAQFLHRVLEREGVDVRLGAEVQRVEPGDEGVRLHLKDGETLEGTHLLIATGKAPNVHGLGLETVGAAFGQDGLEVRSDMRSVNVPWLWGAGDVVGGLKFTHGATERGILAGLGASSWWGRLSARLRAPAAQVSAIPWVTFTDPEVAHWGLTEAQACKCYRQIRVLDYSLKKLDRAATDDEQGFYKLVVRPGLFGSPLGLKIVGAQVVGPRAGELIHLLSAPSRLGFHPLRLALLPFAYPTYAEGARYAMLGLFVPGGRFGTLRKQSRRSRPNQNQAAGRERRA